LIYGLCGYRYDVFVAALLTKNIDSATVKVYEAIADGLITPLYHKDIVTAYLDKTRIKVSIDIGFGDIVYPDRVMMDFPIVLSETAPRVYAYSVYSCIAEKFEAIVSLGYDNSRFKDFYDIYVLANEYDFDGTLLKEAIKETFEYRYTELDDIVAFEDDFSKDTIRQIRWKSFIKKKKAMVNISLEDSITVLKRLMIPIIDSLHNSVDYSLFWDHASYQWK